MPNVPNRGSPAHSDSVSGKPLCSAPNPAPYVRRKRLSHLRTTERGACRASWRRAQPKGSHCVGLVHRISPPQIWLRGLVCSIVVQRDRHVQSVFGQLVADLEVELFEQGAQFGVGRALEPVGENRQGGGQRRNVGQCGALRWRLGRRALPAGPAVGDGGFEFTDPCGDSAAEIGCGVVGFEVDQLPCVTG